MNMKDTHKGMKVKISMGHCEDTKVFCTITSGMKTLRGTEAIITNVCSDGMVQLDHGWTWHPHDMMPVSRTKKIVEKEVKEVEEFFDEKRLW